MKSNKFFCTLCGKFIAHKDFEKDLIHVDFTPDTHFSSEKTEYTHINCKKNAPNNHTNIQKLFPG